MGYWVYIARCADRTFYTGTAEDVDRRAEKHNAGLGAKYTRSRLPVTIVYREACADRSAALRREMAVKHLTRCQKEFLVQTGCDFRIAPVLTPEDFVCMEALEARCYGRDHISPADEAYRWYQAYPDSTVAIFSGSFLAGFINLFPVTQAVSEGLLNGTFNDRDLTLNDIAPIPATGMVDLFLCCIATEAVYRGGALTGLLLRAAMAPYAAAQNRVDRLITDNVTPEGVRFSQRLGLKKICMSDHGSMIHAGSYQDFSSIVLAMTGE